MDRKIIQPLQGWLHSAQRKPLVLRGARQVGKTWAVRHLAKIENFQLIELNFEKDLIINSLFDTNNPSLILTNIEAYYNQSIQVDKTILFLDEIQASPLLLSKLRWFYEELPQLAVIAAGSLLEFVLERHVFSMPVGRISYLQVEPLSFEEFLHSNQGEKLTALLANVQLEQPIAPAIHQQLLAQFKEYLIIGGMPAVVDSWRVEKSLEKVSQLQHDLLTTYRNDFFKYAGKMDILRLDEVLLAIPRMLGEKFIYSHVNKEAQSISVKNALQLLSQARLCHKVQGTYANGIPLGSEIINKSLKVILLDVGLVCSLLGLRLNNIKQIEDINLINKGGVSEQVIGQLLRTLEPFYIEPTLYYWTREVKGSSAEVDYIIQHQQHIIPIEVKSGSTGSLKSLHLFMQLKKLPLAVRINSDLPSITTINIKIHDKQEVEYQLLSIPFYLVGQLHRILENIFSQTV